MTYVRLSDWHKRSDVILHCDVHILSHHAPVKYLNVSICKTFNVWILKKIAEGILRYFANKSAFDDKLKVSCPAGVDNYLICMHFFEANACAFLDTM